MPPVIRIENLSKSYRINHNRLRGEYSTLRESLVEAASWPIKKLRGQSNGGVEQYWALKDINLEIQQGEVVGIIGRNGAGKSTLLKILSRITAPTTGRVELHGRVGSLLEVGTGFHPELTGRENIFLNGSILGMTRREIQKKFDEIVDFSGVEKFLDTPVKRYSSGMYVRLAFAVAAHLEPEILIVDEVLAVGDAGFQTKCMGKMSDIATGGRTILFVSHNMGAIHHLCPRSVLLVSGSVSQDGDTDATVEKYLDTLDISHDGEVFLDNHPQRRKGAIPLLRSIRCVDEQGQTKSRFAPGETILIEFVCESPSLLHEPCFGIGFDDSLGTRIFSVATYLSDSQLPALQGRNKIVCKIGNVALAPGRYLLCLSAGTSTHRLMDHIEHAIAIEINPTDFYGNGRTPSASLGHTLVRSHWDAHCLFENRLLC
jgi:lipopolysaccharide transport system ATP-binding protein